MSESKGKMVSMNFVVPEKFRKDYKMYAALTDRSMTALLSESFTNFMTHERSKAKSNSTAKGNNPG